MLPFLTLEDPNAKIKGSRDALGTQPVWAAFGRHVVANLTTQSTSVRGFTVLLLGRYFGERLIEQGRVPREAALEVFLRMEQVGAYVRRVAHGVEGAIRGIERVNRHLQDHDGEPYIEAGRRGMILSDQKTYGLWGLYTVPARTSGWLRDGPVGLTERARDFVDSQYVAPLGTQVKALERLLCEGGRLKTRRGGDAVFRMLVEVLRPEFSRVEREFYGRDLRDGVGVPGAGLQKLLREELEAAERVDGGFGRGDVEVLVSRAKAREPELAWRLSRIAAVEALLAPATALFDHVLARGGQTVRAVATELEQLWGGALPHLERDGFDHLRAEVADASSVERAGDAGRCHASLAVGDFSAAIRALVDWNEHVMAERSAAPWVRIAADDVLDVRYRGVERRLPARDELPLFWTNSYFVEALKAVTRELRP
jgi:hypothetical protein